MHRDIGYNASKAALNMITTALAGTLGPRGVVAVAIHPGWVRTDMGGSEAPLTAEASASAVLATIDGLAAGDNGRFLNWDGTPHPW
jgi:NAD(P)-dependent dehydrogenase (short-subunit alcohol dehydrogenase family)